jgi:zinc protease
VTPFIEDRSEGLRGNSTTKDLELLFQLAHLYFTSPKADAEVFERVKKTQLENARNRSLNPTAALVDVLNDYRYGDSVRGRPFSEASLQSLELGRALQIYKERFADASDFAFSFVGNFDEATLKDLAQRYLGTLPARGSKESWKQVFFKAAYPKVEKSVNKGKDERGTVIQLFGRAAEFSQDSAFYALALQDLLNIRYTEELREKLGGVYGAGVQVVLIREPYVEMRSLIQFVCDPKRAEELAKASLAVLEEVKTQGVSEANMNKVREQLKRSREEAQRTNNFWLNRLVSYIQYPDSNANDTQSYFERANRLKSQDLQKLAQQLFADNYLQAILFPEK